MAAPSCWRCLLGPSSKAPTPSAARRITTAATTTITTTLTTTSSTTTPTTPRSLAHAFSTSSPARKAGVHVREGKRMTLAKFKKRDVVRPRVPAVGERRAMRKRIVLSNNNAIRVSNLQRMDEANLADPASAGHVFKLPDDAIDQLRKIEAFKSSQTWHLFHSPHMLVRPETVDVCSRMSKAADEAQTARIVVDGNKAAGKSMLLFQAIAHAFMNKWVVIHIPEAQELTTARTEYGPIPNSSPTQWIQPVYTLRLIKTIMAANRRVLDTILTTRSYDALTNPVVKGATLNTLIESAREADQAWPVFAALWRELLGVRAGADGRARPPVLLALDGLAALMRESDYLAPSMARIHSHDFVLVRCFVNLLSGAAAMPAGGAVVAATCRSNAARNPSMELALARQRQRQRQRQQGLADEAALPQREFYGPKYDARVDAALEDTGLHVVDLKGISKAEARALMEYWAASGLLRAKVDEVTVSEKWMTGGNGIIGEMERCGLLTLRI